MGIVLQSLRMDTWIIVLIVVGVLVLFVVYAYNRLIALTNRKEEAWSDIDVQLKRRYDLIPNLVSTVKGYAKHEQGVFERVTEARSKAMQAEGTAGQAEAENFLTGALKSLFAVSENYPDLKADGNFLELQREITDTENKIQSARRFYNATVQDLNTGIQTIPFNLIAYLFSFGEAEFFELSEEAKQKAEEPVKVSF